MMQNNRRKLIGGLGSRLRTGLSELILHGRRPVLIAALAVLTVRVSADSVIDSFERNTISPWTFDGGDSPAATGSVSIGTGHSGKGGVLSYTLSRDGGFASAISSVPAKTNATAISLWLRSPANISVRLRVVDNSGQTLQYVLHRPFTATDPSAWYQQVVALDGPDDHWGGNNNNGKVHNPIQSIAILAAEPMEPGPRDSISFDDIMAISSVGYTLNPSANVTPGPRPSGDLPSTMGVAIHLGNFDAPALAAASAAGFSFVRTDLFWSDVETVANSYSWTKYDALVNSLQSRTPKMNALFILDFGNRIYTGAFENPPTTAAAVTAFGNYAEAAARHFRGTGVRFEVWNEPDGDMHHLDPTQYATLVKEAIKRVHAGDPAAKVSTAGVIGFDYSYLRGFLKSGMNADGIGVHPYDVGNPGGDLVDKLVLLRSIIPQFINPAPPVWQTEWGFSTADIITESTQAAKQKRQALLAARELLSSHAVGFPLFVYYDLRDDGNDLGAKQDNFGLITTDNRDKPAMTAVKTLTRFTRGRTFSGFLPVTPSTLAGMKFDGLGNKVFVLWSSAPGGLSVPITVPSGSTVTNMLGAAVTLQNQRFDLREADGPVYITTP